MVIEFKLTLAYISGHCVSWQMSPPFSSTVQGTAAAVVVVVSFAVVVGVVDDFISMVGTRVHEPEMQVRPVAQRPIWWIIIVERSQETIDRSVELGGRGSKSFRPVYLLGIITTCTLSKLRFRQAIPGREPVPAASLRKPGSTVSAGDAAPRGHTISSGPTLSTELNTFRENALKYQFQPSLL